MCTVHSRSDGQSPRVAAFFFLVIFIIEESREKGMIKTKYRYVTFPERDTRRRITPIACFIYRIRGILWRATMVVHRWILWRDYSRPW